MPLLNRGLLPLAAILVLVSGCGGDETQGIEDHTPESYKLTVNDLPVSAPYIFAEDVTVRVRITFLNAAEENLDEIESSHFARLDFDPDLLATAVRVPGHNYQFDVTGNTPGSGGLQVSFGHDESADEVTFDSELVTVSSSGGGNPP